MDSAVMGRLEPHQQSQQRALQSEQRNLVYELVTDMMKYFCRFSSLESIHSTPSLIS